MHARAANHTRATVPTEFPVHGGTKEAILAREARRQERRQKLLRSIERDQEELREMRWPYVSRRGKVGR